MIGNKIWMHNDFIEILFSLGFIGLLFYLFFFFKIINKYKSTYLFLFIVISGMINGFIYYNMIQVLLIFSFIHSTKLKKNIKN